MSTMIVEVYDALIDAGASAEKAKSAAQVLSTQQQVLAKHHQQTASKADILLLQKDIATLMHETKKDIATLRKETWVIVSGMGAVLVGLMGFGFGYMLDLLNTILGKF